MKRILIIGAESPFLSQSILELFPEIKIIRIAPDPIYLGLQHDGETLQIHDAFFPKQIELFDALILSKIHCLPFELSDLLKKAQTYLKSDGLLILNTITYSETLPHFPSIHALGDALMHNGFSFPVVEKHTMSYQFKTPETKPGLLLAIGIEDHSQATEIELSWAIAHAWRSNQQHPHNTITLPVSRHKKND